MSAAESEGDDGASVGANISVAIAIVAMATLALLVGLHRGAWFDTHDHDRYPVLVDQFRRAFLAGRWYPRWLPALYGGYGYPTFCFYQPGFFFLTLAFSFLPGFPTSAIYGALLVLLVAGGAGAYAIGRELADRATGVLCAALFLVTPYVWVELYVRGDLTELAAMLVAPWPVFALFRLARHVRNAESTTLATLGLGASFAAVVYAHPIPAAFLVIVLALVAFGGGTRDGAMRLFTGCVLADVLGATLSAPYWYPLLRLHDTVRLERVATGYFTASRHLVSLPQLVARGWGFGDSASPYGDAMSLQLGAPHAVLAIAGALLAWRRPVSRAMLVAYVLCIALMTPLARPLWTGVPFFASMQFPWRLLSVIAVVQIGCIAGLGELRARFALVRARSTVVYTALVLATIAWMPSAFFQTRAPMDAREVAERFAGSTRYTTMEAYARVNEFLPRTVRDTSALRPRARDSSALLLGDGSAATALPGSDEYHLRARVEPLRATTATIEQLLFPGWSVRVDGRAVSEDLLLRRVQPDGRITIDVPAGAHEIDAEYGAPPGTYAATVAALVALLATCALVARAAFARRKGPVARPSGTRSTDDSRPMHPSR